MADYIIATSSTSDLTRDWLDEHGVPFIPYTYTVGSDLYEDDCREESRAAPPNRYALNIPHRRFTSWIRCASQAVWECSFRIWSAGWKKA